MRESDYPMRPTWLEINADAITNNVKQIRRYLAPSCVLMAVVKANAYGHGATGVAKVALQAGASRLAVATLAEAIELRLSGIECPILVLGYTPARLAPEAMHHHITLTVYDYESIMALQQAAAAASQSITVHIKINTGMNRLGLSVQDAPQFLQAIQHFTGVEVEGIFTHFATSDLADKHFANQQFHRFSQLLAQLEQAGLRPPLAHAANSAAIITMPQTHLQMVRAGIALYGLHPDPEETRLPASFQPALQWKAQIAHLLHIQPGDSVSYGQEFVAKQPMTVAVMPVGYADGFPRTAHNWQNVLIAGQAAPIIGRICMDQTMVNVTHIVMNSGSLTQGDEIVLIGRQGTAEISVDEIAKRLQTNNYDVVSRILSRTPRIFVKGANSLPLCHTQL
ncbi:MAG: alanine racemase [Caldilineaceae bacterium]|nr:alanine racemase [Caldilineaceae bacterium]MCB9155737.1 alanine racemase [Caldilineaceae bacterium]